MGSNRMRCFGGTIVVGSFILASRTASFPSTRRSRRRAFFQRGGDLRLVLLQPADEVGARAVGVVDAVLLGEVPRRERRGRSSPRRSGPRRARRRTRPTKSGVSEAMNAFTFSAASRQFASVTPKWSSIHSERRKPGVTASAVMPRSFSSCESANAIRMTVVFTRS